MAAAAEEDEEEGRGETAAEGESREGLRANVAGAVSDLLYYSLANTIYGI